MKIVHLCLLGTVTDHRSYQENLLTIYVAFGAVMFVAVRGCAGLLNGGVISVIIEIVVGIIVFGVLCLIYWKATKSEYLGLIKIKR